MKLKLIIYFIFSLYTFSSNTPIIIYCDSNYFPLSYEENGEAKGLYIDILNHIFSKMKNYNIKIQPIPWERGKILMKEGRGFALVPPYYHGYDWKYIYPYSLPLFTEEAFMISLKDSKNYNLKFPEDYYNKTIANIRGYDGWLSPQLRKLIFNKYIKYDDTSLTPEQQLRKLIDKRVDFIILEKFTFEYALKILRKNKVTNKKLSDFNIEFTITKEPVYIGYSKYFKADYSLSFRQEFDNLLYLARKNNELEKIIDKYRKKLEK
ncbi:amino acid ABC transporter substrate-binding protein (PAAT family) [Hypnocyclicus thermotrophus]|uniref:Amino acid ABC transporter substrate-binding protein (PAAT family) n=1 Tax=Hypnocyclicus thermotrophus TaxID=1627895 RepID=A0AA46E0F4_9FUSO|nr:transporter substrate-binding domain-containing protein [Hypnocyclicus thermotrophus]TDT72345.1 amino acid ABC transporter substrate-binding protein (PAAT family) [Hypnocyclicus thermotrophus]